MTERTYAGHTLANLRALSDAATPPQPWVAQSGGVYNGTLGVNVVRDPDARAADLELIVVAVNALPSLCERVAALEARRGDLAGLLAGILECLDHDDTWTKAVRQTTAATIRAALEARDD